LPVLIIEHLEEVAAGHESISGLEASSAQIPSFMALTQRLTDLATTLDAEIA
jgi:hypothetical protein